MKVMPFLSVLALVAGAFAADPEPVYVVSTDVDASLDACTVSVTEGGVTTEKAFSAVTPTVGTFKKRGSGTLTGSTRMSTFTGDILVEEGAYLVNAAGMTGPQNTTAGTLVVSNGASFIVAFASATSIHNTFRISGAGAPGRAGALVNRCTVNIYEFLFWGSWSLDGDATIKMENGSKVISWRKLNSANTKTYFYLNDHTLTVQGEGVNDYHRFSGITFSPGTNGKVIVDNAGIEAGYAYGTRVWEGGPENRLVFRNNAGFRFYNSPVPIPWTLEWNGGATITSYGMTEGGLAGTNGENCAHWDGPAEFLTSVLYSGNVNNGLAFNGEVSGPGDIHVHSGWLKFTGPTNRLTGKITLTPWRGSSNLKEVGLVAHTTASINPASAGILTTNAPIVLVGRDRKDYDLPKLEVHVTGDTNSCISSLVTTDYFKLPKDYDTATKIGGLDAVAAGFRKTGSGTYRILPAIVVTGVTEIVEGTVKLEPVSTYSACPGLWEGITRSRDDFNQSRAIISNRVTSLPLLSTKYGEPWWPAVQTVIYGGYIWNRTGTNVTWSFAGLFNSAFYTYIDGKQGPAKWDGANPFSVRSFTLTPGPHTFEQRIYYGLATSGTGGAIAHKSQPNWKAGMGFALSETACMEGDATKFFVPSNNLASCSGGDGIWFTRDNRWPNEFTAEEYAATRASFDHLVLHAGATLDIANATNFVKTLRGVGTIRNGGLAVKESWSIKYSDIAAGDGLVVDDALVFGDGAGIVFDGEGVKLKRKDLPAHGFVLATAANGIVGTPTVTCADDHWTFRCSADGKTLRAIYRPDGLMMIVR